MSFLKVACKNLSHGIVSVVMAIHNPVRKRHLFLEDFRVFISWTTLTVEGANCQEANAFLECPI